MSQNKPDTDITVIYFICVVVLLAKWDLNSI